MRRQRLPPNKIEVGGCPGCPFRQPCEGDDDAFWCTHPEGHERTVTDEQGVPEHCPLIRAPLLVRLAEEPSC